MLVMHFKQNRRAICSLWCCHVAVCGGGYCILPCHNCCLALAREGAPMKALVTIMNAPSLLA